MEETVAYGLRGTELLNYGELSTPDIVAARELSKYAKENGLLIPCFSVGINLVGEDIHGRYTSRRRQSRW